MKTPLSLLSSVGGTLLLLSGTLQAVVSDNLLTHSNQTSAWQNCEGSDLVAEPADSFDPSHLENSGCAYRETPAEEGNQYNFTCGVSSFKYSSMTLAFLDENDVTLATQTTEILEDTGGGAYSVILTAPAGTVTAAVGIYGLTGSGFQDCTLLIDNPEPEPEDGSIAGVAWFDEDSDTRRAMAESLIPSTPVLLYLNGAVIDQTRTGADGSYYFGGLDLGSCYQLKFSPADPTLTFTGTGGDSLVDGNGSTAEVCLSDSAPNATDIDAGFVAVPPVLPPEDYAVCGTSFLAQSDAGEMIPNVTVTLINVVTGDRQQTATNDSGSYHFGNLPAGDYQVQFEAPAGFEFTASSTDLTPDSSFAGENGLTPQFNVPNDSNTGEDDACTLRNVNAGLERTPVVLDPTIANDDAVTGFVGDTLTISFLDNDVPCDGSVQGVDIIGHNVPGTVSYDATAGTFVLSATTTAGVYSIEYGLRGACGSYDTAMVTVTLEEVPPPPPPAAPDAPKICLASIGKQTGLEPGVHVDLKFAQGQTLADFSPQYNFYDVDMNLVYTGLLAEAGKRDWGVFWRKREHGLEVLNIKYVRAVENGVESNPTECVQQSVTPIAIDIDGNGKVEAIAGKFSFDIDGDGSEETLMQWFSPLDGILIYREFGDRISGEHLLGDTGGLFEHGFAKLVREDANGDGAVSGAELLPLAIWTDRNSNAMIDTGEVSTLAEHSIVSLPVQHYRFAARAQLDNGGSLIMRDLWFPLQAIEQASR